MVPVGCPFLPSEWMAKGREYPRGCRGVRAGGGRHGLHFPRIISEMVSVWVVDQRGKMGWSKGGVVRVRRFFFHCLLSFSRWSC